MRYKRKVLAILLSFTSIGTAHAQNDGYGVVGSRDGACASICLYVNPNEIKQPKSGPLRTDVVKITATLVNNSASVLKVKARGDDWLFYDVMSDLDTVKKSYECHVCYVRTVRPRSTVRFNIYGEDARDAFAIRLRYHYRWESEHGDTLFHYVYWLKPR